MNLSLDCYPCLLRSALEAARAANASEEVQRRALRAALEELEPVPDTVPPPQLAQAVHRRIRQVTGADDPYAVIKREQDMFMLQLEPFLTEHVKSSRSPLREAARLAAACNSIDLGPSGRWSRGRDPWHRFLETSTGEFDLDALERALSKASTLLCIGDNAGEIVADKILLSVLRSLGTIEMTFAVRGAPVLNDATVEDAKRVGMDRVARVITTGSDCPGVILSDCSEEFRECLEHADVVLAKGQGNYETLVDASREIFCLLQAKCRVVARDLRANVSDIILISNRDATPG